MNLACGECSRRAEKRNHVQHATQRGLLPRQRARRIYRAGQQGTSVVIGKRVFAGGDDCDWTSRLGSDSVAGRLP